MTDIKFGENSTVCKYLESQSNEGHIQDNNFQPLPSNQEYWPTIIKKLIHYQLQKPPATWMTEKTNAKKMPQYMAITNYSKHETYKETNQIARQIEILIIKG